MGLFPSSSPYRTGQLTLSQVIELNLRLPSMLHGKKGFERLMWACKNVLVQSVTWLFYDCQAKPQSKEPGVADAPAPIGKASCSTRFKIVLNTS